MTSSTINLYDMFKKHDLLDENNNELDINQFNLSSDDISDLSIKKLFFSDFTTHIEQNFYHLDIASKIYLLEKV